MSTRTEHTDIGLWTVFDGSKRIGFVWQPSAGKANEEKEFLATDSFENGRPGEPIELTSTLAAAVNAVIAYAKRRGNMRSNPSRSLIDFELQRAGQLVGGYILATIRDDRNGYWGLRVKKGAFVFRVWIDQDPEGNGPGHLNIELEKPAGMRPNPRRRRPLRARPLRRNPFTLPSGEKLPSRLQMDFNGKRFIVPLAQIKGHEGFLETKGSGWPPVPKGAGLSKDAWEFMLEVALYGINESPEELERTVEADVDSDYPKFHYKALP